MSAEPLDRILARHDACEDARAWAKQFKTPAEAWDACPNPDWMLWALDKIGYGDKRVLRLFACWSARQVWHLLDDDRSKTVIEVTERQANGEATDEELAAAWTAAWIAAWTAAWTAARAAAWSVARDAAWDAARRAQADQLRRLVGNPFIDFQG